MNRIANLITRGRRADRPLRILMHSQPKSGKTHIAAGAPAPFFLDFEEGTLDFDVERLDVVEWELAADAINFLKHEQHPFKTVVVDTLDAMERLLIAKICHDARKDRIGAVGGGYGRGWEKASAMLQGLLDSLAYLQRRRGMNVVILAHSQITTIKLPDGTEFSNYSLRCNKKTWGVLEGWVDEILFLRRKIQADKAKVASGGNRVIETQFDPSWQAGSRRLVGTLSVPDADSAKAWGVIQAAYAKSSEGARPAGTSLRELCDGIWKLAQALPADVREHDVAPRLNEVKSPQQAEEVRAHGQGLLIAQGDTGAEALTAETSAAASSAAEPKGTDPSLATQSGGTEPSPEGSKWADRAAQLDGEPAPADTLGYMAPLQGERIAELGRLMREAEWPEASVAPTLGELHRKAGDPQAFDALAADVLAQVREEQAAGGDA